MLAVDEAAIAEQETDTSTYSSSTATNAPPPLVRRPRKPPPSKEVIHVVDQQGSLLTEATKAAYMGQSYLLHYAAYREESRFNR